MTKTEREIILFDAIEHIKKHVPYRKYSRTEVMGWKQFFYDLPDGTEPAVEFINAQSSKMSAKIMWTIGLLEEKGIHLREPYSKHLEDGIFELRTELGNDITRVLYFFMAGEIAILTHGFVKKQDKTPPGEIERAKRYRKEYLSRGKEK